MDMNSIECTVNGRDEVLGTLVRGRKGQFRKHIKAYIIHVMEKAGI